MRIGVLGNSQARGLAASFRALLPDYDVAAFETGAALARPASLRAAEAALADCDYVVAHRLAPRWGKLAADALGRLGPFVQFLPVVEFAGFHPDSIMIAAQARHVGSPTGLLHGRIAVLGYLAGYSVGETVSLFNRLVLARLGYLRAFESETVSLAARFAADGLDLRPLQARWLRRGCFMHAPDRPKIRVLLDLALIACGVMEVMPEAEISAADLADGFAEDETHPVLPEVAAACGVPAEGRYATAVNHKGNRRAMNTRDFVAQSFREFDDVEIEALQAADGVAAGMAALGLRVRPPPRRRRALEPGMALMTCHGTVLRSAAGGSAVRHLPLSVPLAKQPAFRLDFPDAGKLHGFDSKVLGGVRVAEGPMAGLVAILRGEKVLCPERDSDSAGFTRDAVGQWEGFWPVRMADLAVLETLGAHDWHIVSTGEAVPRITVRLAPGFELWFGRWRIDLRTDMPVLESVAGGGRPRVRVSLGGEAAVAMADPQAPPAEAARPVAPKPEAALQLGQKRMVTGAPMVLGLPLVARAAERRWLYEAYAGAPPLPAGRFVHAAVLRREAEVRLAFDADGAARSVSEDGPWVVGQSVLAVPPGLPVRAGWVEAALRLFALWPYLPAAARILLPSGGVPVDVALAWQELGVARAPVEAQEGAFIVEDMAWLGQESAALVPGEVLAALRDRAQAVVQAAPGVRGRIFVHGLGAVADAATLAGMSARGFTAVDLGALPPLAQMAAFGEAGWVAGATGLDLAGILFCAAGTRVVELSSPERFVPAAWMTAGKIGLNFALLPGESVDFERFDALTEMLASREM